MPRFKFCQIDTKGSSSYNPIELWLKYGEEGEDRGRVLNLHNAEVVMRSTVEYLNSLLSLQKGIKEKYEPQLIPNTVIEGEPKGPDLDSVFAEEEKRLLKPGAINLFYT